MGKPTAEELLGLHSRLLGADIDFIEKQLNGRLEAKLNSPEVEAKISAAEEAVADFKKNPPVNSEFLDELGETLPEIMETRLKAITQAVGEKIKEDYLEYADQIQGGEVHEEELAKAKERLEGYIEDEKLEVEEIVAGEIDSITKDIGNIKEITRQQFKGQMAEEDANLAHKTAQAPKELAVKVAQIQGMPYMQTMATDMLKQMIKMESPEYAQSVLEQANDIIEQGNIDNPERDPIPSIKATDVFGEAPEVAVPAGGMTP